MRIKELKIATSNLVSQTTFYSSTLGLKIITRTDSSVSFAIGSSILTLEQNSTFTPYHFAINIPCNQENEALNWLKERVEVLKEGNVEIHHFDHWNARAMYFYDEDKNIVEFIARKNMGNSTDIDFDQNSLLEISEIGLVTKNIKNEFGILTQKTNLDVYSGSFERFCAIGDENGLFICINRQLKDFWFPTSDKPYASNFTLRIGQNEKEFGIEFQDRKLKVTNIS